MAIRFEKIDELTDEHKKIVDEFIKEYVEEHEKAPLLKEITQKIDPEADGRSYLGKAIQKYLDEVGINYKTTEYERKIIELTVDQQEYAIDNLDTQSPLDMARHWFGEEVDNHWDHRCKP
jgi:hypothetical protein